jgi:ABC-type transporter Mla subunit MlaD
MIDPSPWVGIALPALLVGAALPVLYQLHKTLKKAHAFLDSVGPRLERTLDSVGQAADRVDRLGASLEAPAATFGPLLQTASMVGASAGRSAAWLSAAASVGGAIAPAVIAGVRAFFSRAEPPSRGDEHRVDHVVEGGRAARETS